MVSSRLCSNIRLSGALLGRNPGPSSQRFTPWGAACGVRLPGSLLHRHFGLCGTPRQPRHTPAAARATQLTRHASAYASASASDASLCISELQVAVKLLKPHSLSTLPSDLRVDLSDAAFALSSGPVLLELGDAAGAAVLQFGRALEAADVESVAAAVAKLADCASSGHFLEGSNGRATLARRLLAAGRALQRLGPTAPVELQQLARATVKAGEKLRKGALAEEKVDAAAVYGRRSFKVGSVELEVSPPHAAAGAVVAALFGCVCVSLGSSLQGVPEGSLRYTTEGAVTVAQSLRLVLVVLGYSSAALSFAACLGLAALAVKLRSDDKAA